MKELGSPILYKCQVCGRHFVLFTNELDYTEREATYITCSYHGKHSNIKVVNRFKNLKHLMEECKGVNC